jgi:NAD(P)-dependent dehydrogenase (short-subunit alcohol dehydrogenase family)
LTRPAPLVVIAGGTGPAARGTVGRLLHDGYRVLVPTRNPDQARALLDPDRATPALSFAQADLASEASTQQLVEGVVARHGAPTHVVAAVGGWTESPPVPDLGLDEFQGVLRTHLVPHLLLAKAFSPVLEGPDPCFLSFNGIAAWEPHPHALPVSVAGAAQRMLIETLAAQPIGQRVRFRELVVWPVILDAAAAEAASIRDFIAGDDVATRVLAVLRGDEPREGLRLFVGKQ